MHLPFYLVAALLVFIMSLWSKAISKGLNKDQVRFILGTALVQDPFHKNRWDYVNKVTVGDLEVSNKKLILYFNSDELLDSWIIEDNS